MNRTRKSCVYRDCDINSQTHPELTLFQFPKNPERAARWCELGLVNPADSRPRYMCERHFSRIYLCFSSRRKMLLNTAVPRAYGTSEDGQEEEEEVEVESSSAEVGFEEATLEEHLDESMAEDNDDDVATEIIYMDPEEDPIDTDQLVEPPSSKKRPASDESILRTKIIKVEQMPAISRSMIVSSSSTTLPKTSTLVKDSLKPITPPKGTILRKVKLKKRPTTVRTIIIKKAQPNLEPNTVVQSSTAEATAAPTAEPTVSSSPEKKLPAAIDSDVPDEEPPEKPCSPKKATEAVASSSNNTVTELKPANEEKKPPTSPSPVKKDESIYEFIFKGEEYVQLPKAKYYGEHKKLQEQLDQCKREKKQMQKKIEDYRQAMKNIKKLLATADDDSSETDE